MSKEKQIDEIETLLCYGCQDIPVEVCHNRGLSCDRHRAEIIYNAGYRKQSEGEWKYPPYAPFGGSYEMKRCSVCGYKPDFDNDNPYTKFCPNCGAKMKGGAE
jgi:membrane protease subunit (stomatin/prohibitin family)